MYIPDAFRESRPEVLHAFLRQHSFATLVSNGPSGLVASHVPVLLDAHRGPHGTLRFHLARPNPQATDLAEGAETMVTFLGPHAYVSPTWYATKIAVPTWNYVAVHAYGTPGVLDGSALDALLRDSVAQYESALPRPWSTGALPAELMTKLRAAIVGFEMEIARLDGKWKLGQNRSAEDLAGAARALLSSADTDGVAIGAMMQNLPR
jgi:transcriptional regulator